MSDTATDWIKPAIRKFLRQSASGKDVRIWVRKVNYGVWVWNEEDRIHIHMPSKVLNSMMGRAGAFQFAKEVEVIEISWEEIRKWKDAS